MKTLIVATDFSPAAGNALTYASRLASRMGSKMVLYHAYHLPIPTAEVMLPLPDLQELTEEVESRLEQIAAEIRKKYALPVRVKCNTSLLLDGLAELCKEETEPLVVVGMRGSSLERKIFGSITTAVLLEGKYPVLVVPAEAGFKEISDILFACDYESLSAFQQLTPLGWLARAFRARIEILHISKTPALVAKETSWGGRKGPALENIFRGIRHSYKEVEKEDIIEGIEAGLAASQADLLVMMPHKPGFWDYILNRSNTCKMALRTPVPLLALPNKSL